MARPGVRDDDGGMDFELRAVTEEEFPAYWRVVEAGFGYQTSGESTARWRRVTELDRTLAVFDRDQIIATAGAFSMGLTVPGGQTVPVAGVTTVGVRPTHRRRGVLRLMMDRQLDDVAARNEPIAILTASESIIYGRFGYGLATKHASTAIDSRYTDFARPLDADGRIEQVSAEDAAKVVPEIHEAARRRQPGDITRSAAEWAEIVADHKWEREGGSGNFWAVHRNGAGQLDGYVRYRTRHDETPNEPGMTIHIQDLVGTDSPAELALWAYVFGIDLVRWIKADVRPLDEPVRWRLADPRRFNTTRISDFVWVRIVDIPAALAARRYQQAGQVTLDVVDGFRPANTGRYTLDGGPDGAACTPAGAAADLTLSAADLGAAYLGGTSLSMLAAAGRVEEHRPGAAAAADAMFLTPVPPFCRTGF